ncbi:MAG: hypothetical protein WC140_05020 [Bacteroidales bacterium]
MDMVESSPDLQAVRVHKQRYGYMVNDTICEFGNVLINGAKVETINSESTEVEDIKKTIKDLQTNYYGTRNRKKILSE